MTNCYLCHRPLAGDLRQGDCEIRRHYFIRRFGDEGEYVRYSEYVHCECLEAAVKLLADMADIRHEALGQQYRQFLREKNA